ncbi:hypothetical protein BX616_001522 [Lobosporangium transversale]|nr:hypothetical protein BX616_001522 [Lobosporangium transversale]
MSFTFLAPNSAVRPLNRPQRARKSRLFREEPILSDETSEECNVRLATKRNTTINENYLRASAKHYWELEHRSAQNTASLDSNSNFSVESMDDNSNDGDGSDSDMDDHIEEEDEHAQDGRDIHDVLDLNATSSNSLSSVFSVTTLGSPPTLAVQGRKKAKRVRVDAHATVHERKVRFDETKNTEHPHFSLDERFDQSTSPIVLSPILSPTNPLFSTLSQPPLSSSFGPQIHDQGEDNDDDNSQDTTLFCASQQFQDVASSLDRLMGNGSPNSSILSPPFTFSSPTSSPIRSPTWSPSNSPSLGSPFTFQDAPPSPVRPAFLSARYSPPSSSSLSSSWSPSFDSNSAQGDSDNNAFETAQVPSPRRPSPKRTSFSPRRPRITSLGQHQFSPSSVSGSPRPRFPCMLKRENSSMALLDNEHGNLTPERPALRKRELSSLFLSLTDHQQEQVSSSTLNLITPPNEQSVSSVFGVETAVNPDTVQFNTAIATILNPNMPPTLKKSSSENLNSSNAFWFDTPSKTSQLKRFSSFDLNRASSSEPLSFKMPGTLSPPASQF